MSDFWRTLTKVGPLVRRCVGEAIGHGAVGAVDDTRATGVLNARDGLLVWVHGLRKNASGLGFVVPRRLTEDL